MKSCKTKYCEMVLIDGVVHLEYYRIDFLPIEIAKQMVDDRLLFCNGISSPHLFDIRLIKKLSKETRDYMANEGNDLVSASALLVGSSVVKMLANFFIMVNKPKNPTKMFTDKDQALEWLRHYKK